MRQPQRQAQALRPFQWLEFGLGFITVLAFAFLSQPGQVNLWGTACLMLFPIISATRHITLYRVLDEYERTLMLRAGAWAFLAVMLATVVLTILGAASTSEGLTGAETVPVWAILLIFLLGWLVFSLSYAVIQRREARE